MYFASRIINSFSDLKKKNNYFCTLITAPLISFSMELSRILITFTLLKIFWIPIYSLDKQHYTLHTALHSLEYASGFHPEICIFVRNTSFTMVFFISCSLEMKKVPRRLQSTKIYLLPFVRYAYWDVGKTDQHLPKQSWYSED